MSTEDARATIRELLRRQRLGVLSTVDGGVPYASLVAFAVSEDDRDIYFVTATATRKFTNLTANPRVALLVTDSNNHREDFQTAVAITATGTAGVPPAAHREAASRLYTARHPDLALFCSDPGNALVVIRVERYVLVKRFQDVTEVLMDSDG